MLENKITTAKTVIDKNWEIDFSKIIKKNKATFSSRFADQYNSRPSANLHCGMNAERAIAFYETSGTLTVNV